MCTAYRQKEAFHDYYNGADRVVGTRLRTASACDHDAFVDVALDRQHGEPVPELAADVERLLSR
jgi:hypothetical protein